jgi:predicted nucleotide-binding protein (sugar kinase/HSP70/actin superfamily)
MNNNIGLKQARLSKNCKYIIDSDGNRVEYDDPRVVHVWPIDTSIYATRMIANFFRNRGWNFRYTGKTNAEVLQYAKKLCSGRECIPCTSITGATLNDILSKRKEDQILVYYSLDQDGPCQNGAWRVVWDAFARRLNLRNVVFLSTPTQKSNYIGQGDLFALKLGTFIAVSDLLEEAEYTLKCLAQDKKSAIKTFEEETDRVIDSAKNGVLAVRSALKIWAENLAEVPLKANVEETPKVLIFGGLNVLFVHYPVTDYFIEQGVIPKVVDFSEGLCWLESENIVRYGFKRGLINPKEQFNIPFMLLSLLNLRNSTKEGLNALKMRLHLTGLDSIVRRARKIAEKSGLLYDVHIPFRTIVEQGHRYVSNIGYTETPVTTGRYLCSIEAGAIDGLINLGSFNCQPAMNSQAIIRPLANKSDIPFASIDCEGPWISTNQRRLLETLAVQAKRVREKKNKHSSLAF